MKFWIVIILLSCKISASSQTLRVNNLDSSMTKFRSTKVERNSRQKQNKSRKQRRQFIKKEQRRKKDSIAKVKLFGSFKKGNTVRLPNLIFVPGYHRFEKVSYESRELLLEVLRAKPNMKVQLQGHICCRMDGKDEYDNDAKTNNLSEMRAKAVCDYLINKGIKSTRLSYTGFGSKRKIIFNDITDSVAAERNRRVEVYILE